MNKKNKVITFKNKQLIVSGKTSICFILLVLKEDLDSV